MIVLESVSETPVWHFLLKAALTWCALSALLVFCWISVREISRQVASRIRRRTALTQGLPRTDIERTCKH